MGGFIQFTSDSWSSSSSMTRYVFEFLLDRLPDGPARSELGELNENNVLLLDLREPANRGLVELLAVALPKHVEHIRDGTLREAFGPALMELSEKADRQRRQREL